MPSDFLLYGSTGFVGEAIARLSMQKGLRPLLAGRNAARVRAQADEFGLDYRVVELADATALDAALSETPAVLHCAGPYIHTFKPMADGCLRTRTHYLDITGEIPVYQSLAARDSEAKEQGVMILPGVGFDVVPTDCLALHLKQRLPSATRLTLAFQNVGPAGMPPGTAKTVVEMVPYGNRIRQNGQIVPVSDVRERMIDFGDGPVRAVRLTWGDIFMAYYSTGIPNIEDFTVLSETLARGMSTLMKLRPLFNLSLVRALFKRILPAGSTAEERARTQTHVWGEVTDDQGRKFVARLHGPEAGVTWTAGAALAAMRKVLDGKAPPGFQTPSMAYGPDFVLETEGVTREELSV